MAEFNVKHRDNERANVNAKKNGEAQDCWDKAIKYLYEASEIAREIIDEIVFTNKTLNIFIETSDTDPDPNQALHGWVNCWMPVDIIDAANGSPISKNSTIRWWGGRPKVKEGRGAELALMHELGHEYQWIKQEQKIRKMKLFDYKYGTTNLCAFNYNTNYIEKIENWVVRKVETPVANQINAYLKEKLIKNQIVETEYNDLLEPIRDKYATMGLFKKPKSIKPVPLKLNDKLLVLEPKGRVRTKAVVDRLASPIKKTKKAKPIFP